MANDIFDPTAMNILQDVDFDPISILNGDTKLDPNMKIVNTGKDDGDDGDDGKGGAAPAAKPQQQPQIELTDEMLQTGLKKTGGLKNTDTGGAGDAGDGKDGKPAGTTPSLTDDDKNNAFAVHYKLMTEAGEWEPIEGFDGSEGKYLEARQVNNERAAVGITEGWFTEAFKDNPDGLGMGKELFNHLRNGGRVRDFVEIMAPTEFDFKALDSEDESVSESAAKDLIRNYYSSIGWKADTINKRILDRSKTGQLVDEAKQIEEPYKDLLTLQQKNESTRIENQKRAQLENAKKINTSLQEMIQKNEGFGSLKLWTNKKEQKEMEDYIFAADPESNTTSFNDELNKELRNPKFLMYLAASLKNKLYENPAALTGTDDASATQKALNTLQGTLQDALLNKDISKLNNSQGQNVSSKGSKYEFDLDNAVVIS